MVILLCHRWFQLYGSSFQTDGTVLCVDVVYNQMHTDDFKSSQPKTHRNIQTHLMLSDCPTKAYNHTLYQKDTINRFYVLF